MPVFLSQRWRRQPQAAVEVDRSHLLMRGVEYVLLGSNPFDLRLKPTVTFTSPGSVWTPGGRAFDSKESKYLTMPSFQVAGKPWTIAGLFTPTSTISNASFVGVVGHCELPGSSVTDRQLIVDSGIWKGNLFDNTLGNRTASTAVAPVTGRQDTLIVTANGANIFAACNGIEVSNTTTAGDTGYTGYTSPEFCIGFSRPAGSNENMGVALALRIEGFSWDASQRRAFFENPWQIFKPMQRRLYINAAAAAAGVFIKPVGDNFRLAGGGGLAG